MSLKIDLPGLLYLIGKNCGIPGKSRSELRGIIGPLHPTRLVLPHQGQPGRRGSSQHR